MISRRPGGRRKIINDFPPAGEAGGKIQNFQNYYCYNNNTSRPLGRPIFDIIIIIIIIIVIIMTIIIMVIIIANCHYCYYYAVLLLSLLF